MGKSKIIYGGEVLIDLSADTIKKDKLLKGYTAHGADGEPIVGIYEATSADSEYTVWEKRTIERYVEYYSMEFGESNSTTASVSSFMDSHKKIIYADYSFDENTGVITLSNPLSTTQTSSADQVINYEQYPYYYGDKSQGNTDNTVYKLTSVTSSGTSSYNKSYTWEFDKAIVSENGAYDIAGDLIETIADTNSTAYPDNGVQDGYWYIKAGSGEGGGNTGGTTEAKLQSKSVTPSESVQTITPDNGYDGLSQVEIEAVPTETKTIIESGTYVPSNGKFFSQVTVNVPTGGGDGLPDVIVAGDTPILASWGGSVISNTDAYTESGVEVTVPKDGTYRFYITATKGSTMTGAGNTNNPTVQLYKNDVAVGSAISVSQTIPSTPYSADVACSAGDVIKVYGKAGKATYGTYSVAVSTLVACIDK